MDAPTTKIKNPLIPSEMNTYKKYCPNVFVAECTEQHAKGERITMTTKHGKEHEVEVHNLVAQVNGKYYYSITRTDGINAQERAKSKALKISGYAANARNRSNQAWQASKEGREFLALGEPIKVGHHSERRHRALIERNHNRMHKAVEEDKKAKEYQARAEYWERKASEINLSMPESLEFYQFKLEQAKEHHRQLKAGEIPHAHSMSMQYASKAVREIQKQVETAVKLWA